jgi:hypothetical protein
MNDEVAFPEKTQVPALPSIDAQGETAVGLSRLML